MTQKLVKYILQEQPDAIICTHFMPTEVVDNQKSTHRYNGLLITVITDFMPHYFWLSPHVDYFIAGLPDTAAELQRRGIPQEKIIENGIPIDPSFRSTDNHRAAKEKMGLDIIAGDPAIVVVPVHLPDHNHPQKDPERRQGRDINRGNQRLADCPAGFLQPGRAPILPAQRNMV